MTHIKVAVVGAGGQLGSNLLFRFNRHPNIHAWGICRNELTAAALRMHGFEVRCGSIADHATTPALLDDSQVIVYCAAAGGMPAHARAGNERVIDGLLRATGQRRIIFFSSVAVYGSCIDVTRNTFENPRPDWVSGIEKLHLERYFMRSLRRSQHAGVVVRVGHVYGAGQWLSRAVLSMLSDDKRNLPFDGHLASNAVHVNNVAAGIEQLAWHWLKPGVYNLFDQPDSTWRAIFDWHSRTLGLDPITSSEEADSEHWRNYYRRRSTSPLVVRAVRDFHQWTRALPRSFLNECFWAKQFGISLLARFQLKTLERRALLAQSRASLPVEISDRITPEPYLFCDAAPGPRLHYDWAVSEDDARAMANWYRRYSSPDSILDWEAAYGNTKAFLPD
jgi:nucleoside-diphosphate-sugar epimerase